GPVQDGGQPADLAPPPPVRRAEGEELARKFFAAAEGGDMDALLGMLAPEVVFQGDGGGKARALARSVTEPRHVAQLMVGGLRRVGILGASLRAAWINGRPGAVIHDAEGRVASVVELDIADGAIRAIHSVSNPDKLGHLGPVSDIARLPKR
ncbi:RNA polymerase sigma factor SigJ, partial [Streptomyces sp. NPDC001130]